MATRINQQTDAAHSFDADQWLGRYEQAGGGYALTPAGSLIFLTSAIDRLSLGASFGQIINRPSRIAAVKAAIIAKEAR
ncbi:MAG: hypothetical protein PGN09_04215 [Sphingomonas fennica]